MPADKIRVFVVEDKGSERSLIKSFMERAEFREQFEFYFWGERADESFDRSERQVQDFVESRQNQFDVIVLDHCWTSAEEEAFRELQDLSLSAIRCLDDSECPSSVRLLRGMARTDTNELPVLVFTWYGFPKWSQHVQQDLGADWTMHKERQGFEDLFRQTIGIHRYRQKLSRAQFGQLTGSSKAIAELRERMKEALRSDIGHIFVSGPSGSGKELVAQILGRALAGSGPFETFSSANLPSTLAELELFGCEQNYPNRGDPRRLGAFRSADGGVLFLDEILDLPIESQPKLFRTLAHDPPEIQVLGRGTMHVNVRLIVASNLSFADNVAGGKLRKEFARRIEAFFPVIVPALSERIADIPDLAKQFCKEASKTYYRYGIHLSDDAISALQEWDWSNGNVSALKGCIRKLVGGASGPTIEASDVRDLLKGGLSRPSSVSKRVISIPQVTKDGMNLAQLESEAEIALLTPIIEDALRCCRGFQSKAAPLLGLTTDQLAERIKKCGIDAKSFRD